MVDLKSLKILKSCDICDISSPFIPVEELVNPRTVFSLAPKAYYFFAMIT